MTAKTREKSLHRILLLVLSLAVVASGLANYLQYRANQEHVETLTRPRVQMWLVRLDNKSIVIAESGECLTERALGLIQKEIFMDIGRIKENRESLSPALEQRFQTSLDRLAIKFLESPDLFSEKVFYNSPSIRAAYLTEIGASDR